MTQKTPTSVARCRCGAAEMGAWGEPIAVNVCYCDDCQAAAQRLAASAQSAPGAAGADGGTEFMLFRRGPPRRHPGPAPPPAIRPAPPPTARAAVSAIFATPQ